MRYAMRYELNDGDESVTWCRGAQGKKRDLRDRHSFVFR